MFPCIFGHNTITNVCHLHTECDMLPSSLTFDVSLPSSRSVGALAEYTCEVGYQLTSSITQRTCLASLYWNGTEPTCSKASCSVTYYQVCYNCDIMDSDCTSVTTVTFATFDECRSSAIINNAKFVEYDSTICKMLSCQVPQITYRNGSVAMFSSCNEGLILVYNGITRM